MISRNYNISWHWISARTVDPTGLSGVVIVFLGTVAEPGDVEAVLCLVGHLIEDLVSQLNAYLASAVGLLLRYRAPSGGEARGRRRDFTLHITVGDAALDADQQLFAKNMKDPLEVEVLADRRRRPLDVPAGIDRRRQLAQSGLGDLPGAIAALRLLPAPSCDGVGTDVEDDRPRRAALAD